MDEERDERAAVARAVDFGVAKLLPDLDRSHAWLLTLGGAPQSYVDLDDPRYLEFEYARRLAHVLDVAAPPGRPLDVVHLGGGALTLPRYVAACRPGSRQRVVEADRGLVRFVAEFLPLVPDSGIEVQVADAREWLHGAAGASADVLVADVFSGARVPARLTSLEYVRQVGRVVRPGGLYVANLADGAPFDFLRPQLATVGAVFRQMCVVAEPAVLRGRRFGNLLLVAGDGDLPLLGLSRLVAADPFPARVEHGEALRRLVGAATPVRDADAVPSPQPPEGTFSLG